MEAAVRVEAAVEAAVRAPKSVTVAVAVEARTVKRFGRLQVLRIDGCSRIRRRTGRLARANPKYGRQNGQHQLIGSKKKETKWINGAEGALE